MGILKETIIVQNFKTIQNSDTQHKGVAGRFRSIFLSFTWKRVYLNFEGFS